MGKCELYYQNVQKNGSTKWLPLTIPGHDNHHLNFDDIDGSLSVSLTASDYQVCSWDRTINSTAERTRDTQDLTNSLDLTTRNGMNLRNVRIISSDNATYYEVRRVL